MVTYNPGDMTYSADIDGHTYTFTMYDADKGFRTMCEVSQLLGSGMNALQKAKASTDEAGKTGLIMAAAAALCSGLGSDPDRSLRLVKRLCTDGVRMDGGAMDVNRFALHFAGKMPTLFRVVVAALEVQFGNFFDLLKSSMAEAKTPAPSGLSNTTT